MIEAHTVGHPTMVGDPIPTFGKGRVCACGTRISMYNASADTCHACLAEDRRMRKAAALRREQEKRSRSEAALRGRRVKRRDVIEYLTEHPGSRSNEIAPALGTSLKSTAVMLRGLTDAGTLRREQGETGNRSSGYRYFIKDDGADERDD